MTPQNITDPDAMSGRPSPDTHAGSRSEHHAAVSTGIPFEPSDTAVIPSGDVMLPPIKVDSCPCWHRILAEPEGTPMRYAQLAHGIDHAGRIHAPLDGEHDSGFLPGIEICKLEHEVDTGLQDLVAGFLIEAAGSGIRRGTDNEISMMLCGPSVHEPFDLQTDTPTPILGDDDDPLEPCHLIAKGLHCLVQHRMRHPLRQQDTIQAVGLVFGWRDQSGAYEAVAGERPYKRAPETAVHVRTRLWDRGIRYVLELLGQQAERPIYLNIRCHRADNDPAEATRPGHEGRAAILLLNSGLTPADTLTGRFHTITSLQ